MQEEIWKDVIGYEGLYQISNYGRVYSVPRKNRGRSFGGGFVIPRLWNNRPYYQVYLSKKGIPKRWAIHRLVALHFIPNPNGYPVVNHIDENPSNNRADNLEWCTQKYNCNYGTRVERIKANMPQNKEVYQMTMDSQIIATYPTIQDAARQTGISAGHICSVCKGDREYANGYKWRYADEELYQQAIHNLADKQTKSKESRRTLFMEKHSRRIAQYDKSGNLIREYSGIREITELHGYKSPCIYNCCNGKLKNAYGYVWRYIDTKNESAQKSLFDF